MYPRPPLGRGGPKTRRFPQPSGCGESSRHLGSRWSHPKASPQACPRRPAPHRRPPGGPCCLLPGAAAALQSPVCPGPRSQRSNPPPTPVRLQDGRFPRRGLLLYLGPRKSNHNFLPFIFLIFFVHSYLIFFASSGRKCIFIRYMYL